MARSIYAPYAGVERITSVVGVDKGGTGGDNLDEASTNLGTIRLNKLGQPNGVATIGSDGKIPFEQLPEIGGNIGLSGSKTIFKNTTETYTITNYDAATTYTVSTNYGTVTRVKDKITYTASGTPGNGGFTINDKEFIIPILDEQPYKPIIESPIYNSRNVSQGGLIVASTFKTLYLAQHLNSDWELASDNNFTNIIDSSYNDTVNLTSWKPNYSNETRVYVRVRYKDTNNRISQWSDLNTFVTIYGILLPTYTGPGPQTLIGQYTDPNNTSRQHGFFGEVSSAEFISGESLASAIGLIAGISQNTDTPWLKFYIDGKIIYVPKKPIRHSCTWQNIYQAGAVYGDGTTGLHASGSSRLQNSIINIGSNNYKVRLLNGANSNPTSDTIGYNPVNTHDSEWNRLFYNIGIANYPGGNKTTQEGGQWANYTDDELGADYKTNTGAYSWCIEQHSSNLTYRVIRGNNGISYLHRTSVTNLTSLTGWRPCLELII